MYSFFLKKKNGIVKYIYITLYIYIYIYFSENPPNSLPPFPPFYSLPLFFAYAYIAACIYLSYIYVRTYVWYIPYILIILKCIWYVAPLFKVINTDPPHTSANCTTHKNARPLSLSLYITNGIHNPPPSLFTYDIFPLAHQSGIPQSLFQIRQGKAQ